MTKEELQQALDKAHKQLSIAEKEDEKAFVQKKIDKLTLEIENYTEAPPVVVVKPSKVKAKVKPKVKGKGLKALLKDEPLVPIDDNDPDCNLLLSQHREYAKKLQKASKRDINA